MYYGEHKNDMRDGHGCYKYLSGNEEYGEYKKDKVQEEVILKENDQLFRVKYDKGNLIEKVKLDYPPL